MHSQTALKASHSVRIVTLPSPRSGGWGTQSLRSAPSHHTFPLSLRCIIASLYSQFTQLPAEQGKHGAATARSAREEEKKKKRCHDDEISLIFFFFFFLPSFLPFLNSCAVIYILAREPVCSGIRLKAVRVACFCFPFCQGRGRKNFFPLTLSPLLYRHGGALVNRDKTDVSHHARVLSARH